MWLEMVGESRAPKVLFDVEKCWDSAPMPTPAQMVDVVTISAVKTFAIFDRTLHPSQIVLLGGFRAEQHVAGNLLVLPNIDAHCDKYSRMLLFFPEVSRIAYSP